MNLDFNKPKHRVILLLMIAVPILIIGFLFTFITQKQEATSAKEKTEEVEVKESTENVDPSPSPEETEPEKVPVEEMSQEEKDASKVVAEKFAEAYSNYDAADPEYFILNAKPYMSEGFYMEWEKEPPRKPLAMSKSTVKEVETYPVDGGDKYTIAWNVIVTEETINTLGDIGTIEEWFWILMDKENGEWKVKDVDVTNG